jgi:polyhydroxyalkanoate synthesis regulator phasin
MSTPPPPEPPTRRLEPTAAPPPPPVYERVVEPGVAPVGADPNLLFVRLEDSISSLRTALMFVGILAVLAIGIAIYALTRDDTPAGTSGAVTSQQVTQLNDRVDRLSRQLQQLRADVRGTSALASRVDALSRSVSTLRSQAGSGAAATDQTQAIQALNKRVDDLARQVQTLSQGQTTTP